MKVRTIKLLKQLLSVSYPITMRQLSSTFAVSTRTVQNLVLEANDYLEQLNLPIIMSLRNKGIQLNLSAEEKTTFLRTIFQQGYFYLEKEERELDILLSIAFSTEPIFLNKKEVDYSVSKSTIDEDMRRLRKRIAKFDITIVSSGKQGLVFEGSERSIRTMLVDIINQEIGLLELDTNESIQLSIHQQILYKYVSRNEVGKLASISDNYFKEIADDLYIKQILLFTVIWLSRLRLDQTISVVNGAGASSIVTNSEVDNYILLLLREFELEVNDVEIDYFKFILHSLNTSDSGYSIEWVNAQMITIRLIEFVEEKTQIPFHRKEEHLYESLYNHIYSMILRVKSGVQVFNPILDSIKENYADIYMAVYDFSPNMENIIGMKISESELSFLAIHFSTIDTSLRQENSFFFKCAVICNHGIATSNLLAANLKKKFPEVEIVATMGTQELSLLDQLDVDLVFSTYPIEAIDIPLIVVEPVISNESTRVINEFLRMNQQHGRFKQKTNDYTPLFNSIWALMKEESTTMTIHTYHKLQQLFEDHELKIKTEEIQPMLKDKLKDNNIIMNRLAENWEEAIQLVALPLLKESIITDNYVRAMINAVKVNGPYIVIGKNLALAHARPEDGVNELGISVAKLSTPVEFGSEEMDPVKIIFCLAATDSFSHLTIMKELVYLIQDEQRLEELIQSETKEEFKKILFENDL